MPATEEAHARLAEIPNVTVSAGVPLSRYTRFGIGGPADILAETAEVESFVAAAKAARASGLPVAVIGAGANLIASDRGFRGIVLRYRGERISASGECVAADAGALLQDLVDFTVARGLKGLETLAGIPGTVGAAVYGNAGAYGHSISERVATVRFYDGREIRRLNHEECAFEYRGSTFKRHKNWVIFSAGLVMELGDPAALRATADEIVRIRNEKFPATMKCAGSIFKNLVVKDLAPEVAAQVPDGVVREGKVAAAWFLEQAGAKGMSRGDIHVADYHANLIYNGGSGSAADLRALIRALKARVRRRFGLDLEEEVQYVG